MDNKKFSGKLLPKAGFYLWIILALIGVIAVLDWRVAIPGVAMLFFLIYYNFRSSYKRRKELTKYIENLTFNVDTATKDTLLNFPMPLVVIELDGVIVWYNSSFRRIFEGENLLERTIDSLVQGLELNVPEDGSTSISKHVKVNEKHYNVLGNYVKIEGKSEPESIILLLYFIENTELVELKKRYYDEKSEVGIIVIDNYDDLMQSMEDSSRQQMLAEIEKMLAQWLSFSEGIIKKFERDKYIFIFEHKYLKEMENRKFDILDGIKEINLGNKIPVTLSMGFGINGDSPLVNFRSAGASLDIALGRGGDQVVIKNGNNFSFFGGKTREFEKRTRVKARVIAYALRELVDQSPDVMIMGHENGDNDSLGASLGVYRAVKSRGKDAHIILSHSNPTIEKLLQKINKSGDYNDLFLTRYEAMDRISNRTLLIIVDTYKPGFTEAPELLERSSQVVVIDHHRRGVDFIQDAVLTYQETYASSTCELVTEILQYIDDKLRLKPLEAEALYAGIVVDTKNFTFKTGVRTFEAASYLRRQGVDTVAVKQLFQNDISTYLNISNVVRDSELLNENIALSLCPNNLKNALLITAKAADELLNLSGITAAFVLCYVNNEVFISGRSLGEINVQVILEKLGGGGHLTVAGAQLQDISIEDAKEKLKYVIMEYINSQKVE